MVKPGKSSASSNTRKKHAKKSAGPDEEGPGAPAQQHKKQRGQKLTKAQKKALPKVKQYIPPPKPPAPPIPDPLDGQGLARTLPAELVVILRRLGKKDDVTRRKGLEELREGWVMPLIRGRDVEGDDEFGMEMRETAILAAVPVWMHNLAGLLQSPFHRSSALQLHNDLLSIESLRTAILDTLSLSLLPGTQNRDIIGSWLVASLEEGRRAGGAGIRVWEESTTFTQSSSGQIDLTPLIPSIIEYLSLSILDPATLHEDIHPPPVSINPGTSSPAPSARVLAKSTKVRPSIISTPSSPSTPAPEDEELEAERWTRYRVAGLVGLSWLIQKLFSIGIAALPEELLTLLKTPLLWTTLSSSESSPLLEYFPVASSSSSPFGYQQPAVRRAGFTALTVLTESYLAEIQKEDLVELLSVAVLSECWLEKEAVVWETAGSAVIKFLSSRSNHAGNKAGRYADSILPSAEVRSCWEIAMAVEARKAGLKGGAVQVKENDDDDDEDAEDGHSDDEDAEEDEVAQPAEPSGKASESVTTDKASTSFAHLLEFISTTCPSIPHLTYPLLLVIISTIPPDLLPLDTPSPPSTQLSNLLSHLWSPFDSRLLSTHALPGSPSAFQAFLQSTIDCITYLVGKSQNSPDSQPTAVWLINEYIGGRIWKDGVLAMGGKAGGRRGVRAGESVEKEAGMFGQALERIFGISEELLDIVLPIIQTSMVEACFPVAGPDGVVAPSILGRSLPIVSAVKQSVTKSKIDSAFDQIVIDIATRCTEVLLGAIEKRSADSAILVETLVEILKSYPPLIGDDLRQSIVRLLTTQGPAFAETLSPDLVVALYAAVASDAGSEDKRDTRLSLWSVIDSSNVAPRTRLAISSSLLAAPDAILLSEGSLDKIAVEATEAALSDHPVDHSTSVASSSIRSNYISQDALHTVLVLVSTSIHDSTFDFLNSNTSPTSIEAPLEIFAAYAEKNLAELINSDIYLQALVAIHHHIHVLPRITEVPASKTAISIWSKTDILSKDDGERLFGRVMDSLASLMLDVTCRVDPSVLIDAATASIHSITSASLHTSLLPSIPEILIQMARHTSQPPNPSLPIIDPLIPYTEGYSPPTTRTSDYDISGRSRIARLAQAILILLRSDRKLAINNPEYLRIALSSSILAKDAIAVPGSSRGIHSSDVDQVILQEVIRDAEGILSYSLSSIDETSLAWHTATIQILRGPGLEAEGDFLQQLLVSLKNEIQSTGGDVESRLFRDVLSRHLRQSGAGESEGEAWLGYAMSLIDKAPQLSLAILLAIKLLILDSKAFATAQNRLANSLTTIPTNQVPAKGIPAIRLLIASAPPSDAASVFIPQQRAIFVLRHVGLWLTDDDTDDFPEDLEARVLELYGTLAPIVQDVPGGHWDSIFDLIENGLEVSSLDDDSTFVLLFHSLSLLQVVWELCLANKSLRAAWTAKDVHMGLVLKLFLQCRNADSTPLQLIQALILDLLQQVPEKLTSQASMSDLCDLLKLSNSSVVQCAAYQILNQVIRQQTLALVLKVEASVAEAEDGHAVDTIVLPAELVEIVEIGRGVDWFSAGVDTILAQLLAWLAILDHFEDASTSLRWAYVDQLTSGKLLNDSLLPMLFSMLGVSEMGAWNFPASQYAVDEFYPDFLQPEDVTDLVPLASHLFYRTLVTIPSAMRKYYESLKDRQLSLSLLTFTARYYSPIIITHELATLRQPSALATLAEEGLNVKITQGGGATLAAGSGGAEAIASYVVDEQPMEIGIRLPAEFPLRGVDVRDLRRVGVPENKWRGWLMSVQQTITSRNGLIMEALTVFKRNVSLHFEGVVECAICYSIISLTDRTLPTKPCRTCKNRFHASCLFKWFNSSHSSSCPLCRSLF